MPFFRLSNPSYIPDFLKNSIVAIGNFDGVHCGHQLVLQSALKKSKIYNRPSVVLTFEPHPRSVFNPSNTIERLTPAKEKAKIFRILGFDAVIEKPFTVEFSKYSSEFFVENILLNFLNVYSVIIGNNFHFGHNLQGDIHLLRRLGKKFSFQVKIVKLFRDLNGKIISSSNIREYLKKGLVNNAAKFLGYRYSITEKVIRGSSLGRSFGFPTANMILHSQVKLKFGVYAVKFHRANGKVYNGVSNFGCRPTLNKIHEPLLETYIFDFSSNLYDEYCSVSFYFFLRKEKKFNSLNSLITQMYQDKEKARMLLLRARPISSLDFSFTF